MHFYISCCAFLVSCCLDGFWHSLATLARQFWASCRVFEEHSGSSSWASGNFWITWTFEQRLVGRLWDVSVMKRHMLRQFEKKRNVSFNILWACYAFLVYIVKERDEMVMMQRNEARVFRAWISFTGWVAGRCWGKFFSANSVLLVRRTCRIRPGCIWRRVASFWPEPRADGCTQHGGHACPSGRRDGETEDTCPIPGHSGPPDCIVKANAPTWNPDP